MLNKSLSPPLTNLDVCTRADTKIEKISTPPTTQILLPHPHHNSTSAFVLVLIKSDNGRVWSHRRVSWILKCCRPHSGCRGAGECLPGVVSGHQDTPGSRDTGENSQLWGDTGERGQSPLAAMKTIGKCKPAQYTIPWDVSEYYFLCIEHRLHSTASSVEISWMKNSFPSWEKKP